MTYKQFAALCGIVGLFCLFIAPFYGLIGMYALAFAALALIFGTFQHPKADRPE
jgi:hypothetical protein